MLEYTDSRFGDDFSIIYSFGFMNEYEYKKVKFFPLDTMEIKYFIGVDKDYSWRTNTLRTIYTQYPVISVFLDREKRRIEKADISARVSVFNEDTLTYYITNAKVPIEIYEIIESVQTNDSYLYILNKIDNLLSTYGYPDEIPTNYIAIIKNNILHYYKNGILEDVQSKLGSYTYNLVTTSTRLYDVDVEIELKNILPPRWYDLLVDQPKFQRFLFFEQVIPYEPLLNQTEEDSIYDDLPHDFSYISSNQGYMFYMLQEENYHMVELADENWFIEKNLLSFYPSNYKNMLFLRNSPKHAIYTDIESNLLVNYLNGTLKRKHIVATVDSNIVIGYNSRILPFCFPFRIARHIQYHDTVSSTQFYDYKKDEILKVSIRSNTPYADVYFLPQTGIPYSKYARFDPSTIDWSVGMWKNEIFGEIAMIFPLCIDNFRDDYAWRYRGIYHFGFLIAIKPKYDLLPENMTSIEIKLDVKFELELGEIRHKSEFL